MRTGERIDPVNFRDKESYLMYLRHLEAYKHASCIIPPSSLVLDVGCGYGYGTRILSGEFRTIGIDVNEDIINSALIRYGHDSMCDFAVYDGTKIPYIDEVFDAVVSFQVIEHVLDDENFISEIHRVLRPRGMFILTTPNKSLRLKHREKPWNKYHKREYTWQELYDVLSTKFQDIRIMGVHGSEKVRQMETDRIKHVRFPYNLIKAVYKALKPSKSLFPLSNDEYYCVDNNPDGCLDLMGISIKT